MPPTTEIYTSENGRFRVVAVPTDSAAAGRYLQRVYNGEGVTNPPPSINYGRLSMQQRRPNGRWATVWSRRHQHFTAPGETIITNDGRYTITFGGWGTSGYGSNEVLIYGPSGAIINELSLVEITSNLYFQLGPRTVSSIHWLVNHQVDSENGLLLLQIADPNSEILRRDVLYAQAVRLSDGQPIARSQKRRNQVFARLCNASVHRYRTEAQQYASFFAPLEFPERPSDRTLHEYLREHALRSGRGLGSTTILDGNDGTERRSYFWFREQLTEEGFGDLGDDMRSFAAHSGGDLMAAVQAVAPTIPTGHLRNVRLRFVVNAQQYEQISGALAHTGAIVERIDSTIGVPQSQRRIAEVGNNFRPTPLATECANPPGKRQLWQLAAALMFLLSFGLILAQAFRTRR